MDDYVTFRKDVYQDNGDLIFRKNFDYRLLLEDDKHYFISPYKTGNKCSQFPLKVEGEVFSVN